MNAGSTHDRLRGQVMGLSQECLREFGHMLLPMKDNVNRRFQIDTQNDFCRDRLLLACFSTVACDKTGILKLQPMAVRMRQERIRSQCHILMERCSSWRRSGPGAASAPPPDSLLECTGAQCKFRSQILPAPPERNQAVETLTRRARRRSSGQADWYNGGFS